MHGLVFETSIYYWQDQPGIYHTDPSRLREQNVSDHRMEKGVNKNTSQMTCTSRVSFETRVVRIVGVVTTSLLPTAIAKGS